MLTLTPMPTPTLWWLLWIFLYFRTGKPKCGCPRSLSQQFLILLWLAWLTATFSFCLYHKASSINWLVWQHSQPKYAQTYSRLNVDFYWKRRHFLWISSEKRGYLWQNETHPSQKHVHIILTPLKPHFHIVYIFFFLFLLYKLDCGYSLELPQWGSSNKYPQSMFWAEYWKNIRVFYLKIISFWRWNFRNVKYTKIADSNLLSMFMYSYVTFNTAYW